MPPAEVFFVTRTMEAMELLAFQPASAPQIAGALRVHPGTARRLLNRLVEDGWLIRSEAVAEPTRRRCASSPSAAQLASRDLLPIAAKPIVDRLHEETGHAAHLCIPSYRSALRLVHRAGAPEARPQFRELVPAHAAAAGKVLLGHRDAGRASILGAAAAVADRAHGRRARRGRARGCADPRRRLCGRGRGAPARRARRRGAGAGSRRVGGRRTRLVGSRPRAARRCRARPGRAPRGRRGRAGHALQVAVAS